MTDPEALGQPINRKETAMSDFDYTDLTCPMPGDDRGRCRQPLHLEWRASRPLFRGDLSDPDDLPGTTDAYASSWRITCQDGHVILLPDAGGCPTCGDNDGDCRHNDFDTAEEARTFRPHDLTRLNGTLDALGGVLRV